MLFLLNALHIGVGSVYRDVLGSSSPPVTVVLDLLTNGVLVVAAELAYAELMGRKPWVGAIPIAGLAVAGANLWAAMVGSETWAFLLLSYAYAAVRLAQSLRGTRGSAGSVGATWLAAAFLPRFLEFTQDGVVNAARTLTELAPLTWVFGLAILLAALVACVELARGLPRPRNVVALLFLASGALLGATRLLMGGANDTVIVLFTLAVLRPVAVLAGVAEGGLFVRGYAWTTAARHLGLMALGVTTFAVVLWALPALMPPRARVVDVLLAFAVTMIILPLWGLALERLLRARGAAPTAKVVEPVEPAPAEPTLPPGLDPACRFSPEDIEAYHRSRAVLAEQPSERRRALASLTRRQRVLLALLQSSRNTLGDPRFSQTGLQWATHIPYRYLSTVIRDANAGSASPRIVFSTGVRGQRYYWLSPHGTEEAVQLAGELGLAGIANLRELLGEAFHRPQSLAESSAG